MIRVKASHNYFAPRWLLKVQSKGESSVIVQVAKCIAGYWATNFSQKSYWKALG